LRSLFWLILRLREGSLFSWSVVKIAAKIYQKRPVGVLAREGEATVSEAEEVLLLVIDQCRVSPPYLAEFHLQLVAQRGVPLSLLGASFRPGALSSTLVFSSARADR